MQFPERSETKSGELSRIPTPRIHASACARAWKKFCMSAARPSLVGANECMLSAEAAGFAKTSLGPLARIFFFCFLFFSLFLPFSPFILFLTPLSTKTRGVFACLAAAISASHLRYFRRSWPTDAERRGEGDTKGSRKDQRGTAQGSRVLARRQEREEGRV